MHWPSSLIGPKGNASAILLFDPNPCMFYVLTDPVLNSNDDFCKALRHYSYVHTESKMLLCDLQEDRRQLQDHIDQYAITTSWHYEDVFDPRTTVEDVKKHNNKSQRSRTFKLSQPCESVK